MVLSDLSIKRPVLMTMVLAALLLFGIIGFLGLPYNLMPAVNIPYVTVQTIYPGAAPDQVATQITQRVEDEVSTISEIKNIQSYSLNSASILVIEFKLSKDPDVATREVKDKVDQIVNELPADADLPVVRKVDITAFPVVNLILRGDLEPVALSELASTTVKDQLSRIAGVGEVSISGDRSREIRVEFENRTVYENAVSLAQVGRILAAANLDMPGGNIQSEGRDFSVRLEGQFAAVDEVADLDIPTSGGNRRLGSMATVRDVGADVRSRTIFFDTVSGERDENTVLMGIVKSPNGNPAQIADAVRAQLPAVEKMLPAGVTLTITNDDSVAIRGSVEDTLSNIFMGIGLTALVLLLFLHDLRSTIIVALAMPMSIIPSFLVMNAMGMSLNIMSLMGISTAVGVLVMNSVVVLENIFRHKDLGRERRTAAARGTSEVTVAVVASTMTNIAVFLPMATMSGMAGLFLREFALAVSIATIFSMLISFTLTPMLASRLLPEVDRKKHPIGEKLESWFHALERGYHGILESVLRSRLRSGLLVGGVLIAFVVSLAGFGLIPFDFFPSMDRGELRVSVELTPGTDLERTADTLQTIEERITKHREVVTGVVSIGSMSRTDVGTNLATIDLKLVGREERDGISTVAGRIGSDLADIPGAQIRISTSTSDMSSAPVEFYLQGDDSRTLAELARRLRPMIGEIPGLMNIDVSSKPGTPEIVLRPDRLKLTDAGISVQEAAVALRAAVEGVVMTTFHQGGEEYDIRVMLKDEDVSGYDDIAGIIVPTRAGLIPIGQFADVRLEEGVNQILREDKIESIAFTADLTPGTALGEVTGPIDDAVRKLSLPVGYQLSWGGDAEMMKETVREFGFVFLLAIVLTYMLLAAMLEKFGQPILILSTIPLSLIGVVAAFLLTGGSMNIIAMLAIVMLVGLVVNNAILIMDYANQLQAEGKSVRDSLLEAAPTKLKPILMANIATMLGMLPMALGIGSWGAEMRMPMGIVSIGGLAAATFLSLFVIPALENLVASRRGPSEASEAR